MILDSKLDFWIKNNLNVLFRGPHGVGKTSLIIKAFERAGVKWKYFSAATMDPFVDFIGIPREVTDEYGNRYLDLIKPKEFANDEVEALVFDEFNRAPKKVRNAVMELLQFKSINGKKFNNLKIVWAAINPDDEDQTYDVETLDPAQLDRFHVCIDVPYLPDLQYFKDNYGEQGETAVVWWLKLPADLQKLVTPRRLEYALKVYQLNGDIRDILSDKINATELIQQLATGSFLVKLQNLFISKNDEKTKAALENENFYAAVIDEIKTNNDYLFYFHSKLPEEKLSAILVSDAKVRSMLLANVTRSDELKTVVESIIDSSGAKTSILKELQIWLDAWYPTNSPEMQANLNSVINAAFRNKILDNITEKKSIADRIAKDPAVWLKDEPKVIENVFKFVCHAIIRTQGGTMQFKHLYQPLSRIIYFGGYKEFDAYVSRQQKNLMDKFGNRVEKIDEFLDTFYVDYLRVNQKDMEDEYDRINSDILTS